MASAVNVYSQRWFEFFHTNVAEARTIRETDFIARCAPFPEFQKIVDVYCGGGRHARALASRGYSLTGIDRDAAAIAHARERDAGPNYVVADVRDYQFASETFDAAIVMGQSFGHFDAATNCDLLRRLADSVRKRGRVILDLWNPEFFEAHQGQRQLDTARGTVHEDKRVERDRLFVELRYPDGTKEKFEWELFTPDRMKTLAETCELFLSISCSGFDATSAPSPADPRIQFVLERMPR